MKCGNCGRDIAADAVFCPYCGKPVSRDPEEREADLVRPREGRILGGVAAGMAAHFRLPVTAVRVAFVVLSIITAGLVALLYLGLCFLIPEEGAG